jgi:hypothetical protein
MKPNAASEPLTMTSISQEITDNFAGLVNYLSDLSDDSNNESGDKSAVADVERHSHQLPAVPSLKRQKLANVPYHKQRKL